MRNAWTWPLASTRIAERPVTTALEPTTRTSRASGAIEAYRRVPLPKSCRSSALVFWTPSRSEEHTSELQSRGHLVCRLLLEKKKNKDSAPRAAVPHADC